MSRVVGILIVIPYVLELIEANAESFRNHKYKEWFIKCFKQGFWTWGKWNDEENQKDEGKGNKCWMKKYIRRN